MTTPYRPKLFISYRRSAWAFTHRLGDALKTALPQYEFFIDLYGVDQDDFERAILSNLHNSQAVLVSVTPETFDQRIHNADDWVRKEIAEALRLNKPIIQVGMNGLYAPEKGLPSDIQGVAKKQGVAIYPDYWQAGVERLAEFIQKVVPTSAASQTRQPQLGDRWTEPKTGLKMVYVPPGEFLMGSTPSQAEAAFEQAKREHEGSPKEWFMVEVPQHRVRITRGFWLGLTPVTNAMYAKFVAAGGYTTHTYWTPEGWQWKGNRTGPDNYDGFTAPDQPRVGVTWYEAVAFCNWAGLRLPTEAEWEYAARGPQNRVYPWGDTFDPNRVIYRQNSGGKTHPVGEGIRVAGASWVGALDMSGNVWEWGADWYDANTYATSPADDPSGPPAGNWRVLRGGSWVNDITPALRGANRTWNSPDVRLSGDGFRCARSL
jgi:formylglycine-generating enzyme required for sulfatase activity